MIHIYYAYIHEKSHKELIEKHLFRFPEIYQQKIHRYRRWQDAQLSLLGRLLLVHGMNKLNKNFDDYQLEYTDYNKPFFVDSNLKFNISHSGNIVVCAITEGFEVGIDLELINEIKIESFKSQMTAYEWKRVNESENKTNAFYEYWTKKEAVVKAHGEGLSIPLKKIEIINGKTVVKDSSFITKEVFLDKKYKSYLAILAKKTMDINFRDSKKVTIKKVHFESILVL
ncbi:4'-phosphopantetheinyl transferase superfamily protein [Kordia sp. YSTF-M3]|uniref:4'-phosphopantetheinyl transferase superfamily protein n=1 Tax=Kordia aestuariivivens TaxID=2759037 RepID=A0ABR7QE66_9FLAO|nr:4'-phosphopantetheinyl transferase superfamily protein [Kordia aestuariivivens]MBC8756856.1 4'-phosphopantetheinyl transferase superfamily protein [Kordia aestuariivivens]